VVGVEADGAHDAGVVELVLEDGLAADQLQRLGRRGDLDRDELAGDLPVLGLPHFAEAALAELGDEDVFGDRVALADAAVRHELVPLQGPHALLEYTPAGDPIIF
jgi:hypothetical protein